MGLDLYESSPAARQIFDTADRVLGYELSRVCFEGPEDKLRDTEQAQPAILTASIACLAAAVESGAIVERPAFTAGHSLGELSAIVAAGGMSFEDGLLLVRERARLMAEAGRQQPGTMAAILGLDEAAVREVCAEADADVCNLNLPAQTVIGGTREAVAKAIELAKARGAQRALELNVSGAFHSRLMQPAAAKMADVLAKARIEDPNVPIIANSSATLLRDAAVIRAELSVQVARPVLWHQSITLMTEAGVTSLIEFGPGKVLTGLAKRLAPEAKLANISSSADLSRGVGTPV
jgi:[acyl-carrier-protein] S-malonyltransferase